VIGASAQGSSLRFIKVREETEEIKYPESDVKKRHQNDKDHQLFFYGCKAAPPLFELH